MIKLIPITPELCNGNAELANALQQNFDILKEHMEKREGLILSRLDEMDRKIVRMDKGILSPKFKTKLSLVVLI